MNEVYCVEVVSGSWDTKKTRLAGLYLNYEDAQELAVKIRINAKKIVDSCPVKYTESMSEEMEFMTEEEERIYDLYCVKYEEEMNLEEVKIKTYPLNKEIINNKWQNIEK